MLMPASVATIHKSQGSEYAAVVIPVLNTGVARAANGWSSWSGRRRPSVAIAVRNVSGGWRWSKLSEWLATKDAHALLQSKTASLQIELA